MRSCRWCYCRRIPQVLTSNATTCGFVVICIVVGMPLFGVGMATLPTSLTREEAVAAGPRQPEALQEKIHASSAYKEVLAGIGFLSVAMGTWFIGWIRITCARYLPGPATVEPEVPQTPEHSAV